MIIYHILTLSVLLEFLLHTHCSNLTYSVNNIIEIPHMRSRNSCGTNTCIPHRYYHRRYQDPDGFPITSSSLVFTKVTGLTLAVHHTVPMIYKVRLQIYGWLQRQYSWGVIRFLVNNKVLISNKFYPNNEKRMKNPPHIWKKTMFPLDWRGGSLALSGSAEAIGVPYFKSELIVLPPGTHFLEVGARVEDPEFHLWGGELLVEMTEFNPSFHSGLEYPTNAYDD